VVSDDTANVEQVSFVAVISGGALFPPVLGAVADALEGNTQHAFFIPLIGFVIAFTFPVYLNVFKAKTLDAWTDKVKIGIEPKKDVETADEKEKTSAEFVEKL
jgi:MFS transporter, FHS family, L-fucose permease